MKSKVTNLEKIAFGFGMLANQMFPAALGIFIIVLILIRVPNVNTAAMDIDQNPKFLNPLIGVFIGIDLTNMVYNQIQA